MNNTLIAVLVIVIIGVVGYLAYSQGYFQGTEETEGGIEINLGGEAE